MSPVRTVDALPPPPSQNRLEASKPQRAASIARTPVEQGLDALDAAVNNTVSSINALSMQSDPRAYGLVAQLVSDVVRGIQASNAGRLKRDQWANALGTAIQARINALRGRPDPPASQESIMFLERVLLEISTLQDANPAEPPAMPPPPHVPLRRPGRWSPESGCRSGLVRADPTTGIGSLRTQYRSIELTRPRSETSR